MTAPIPITLLTQHACGYCEHAKQVLERVGRDYPMVIAEIDLAGPQGRRLAEQAGVLFAPGVLVDGMPFSFGRLSERKLRRVLSRRTSAG